MDLTPFKTCSFDCIFCQLGATTDKTLARREYVPVDGVIAELEDWIRSGARADYITLAGSGEPTLHARFGEVIAFARRRAAIPVALLTNGTLFADPDVRRQAAGADVVKLSLSAWDPASLERINRPHPDLAFADLIEGQRRFRAGYRGALWMEVFLVRGFNDAPADVTKIAKLVKPLRPDKVQLNTAVRPPCEPFAAAVPEQELRALADLFDPPAEIIAEYSRDVSAGARTTEAEVRDMLERRPCTLEEISRVFGLHRNEASKFVGRLTRTGRARARSGPDGRTYYVGVRPGRRREDDT
ncbi:MAG: radical SAM protein [Lentisphaerae bacterium]|nr:radical SAM protein [Lentisphaerota bacterium]